MHNAECYPWLDLTGWLPWLLSLSGRRGMAAGRGEIVRFWTGGCSDLHHFN